MAFLKQAGFTLERLRTTHHADAALLAAVLPNPKRLHVNQPSEHVRERQRWILRHIGKLRRYGWLNLIEGKALGLELVELLGTKE